MEVEGGQGWRVEANVPALVTSLPPPLHWSQSQKNLHFWNTFFDEDVKGGVKVDWVGVVKVFVQLLHL